MGGGDGRGGNEKAWDGVFVAVICTGRVYFYYRLYNYSLTSDQKHCNGFTFCILGYCGYIIQRCAGFEALCKTIRIYNI